MKLLPQQAAPARQVPTGGLSAAAFALLRDLIHRESGILLGEGKMSLLAGRLARRLRALKLDSFDAYYRYLMDGRDPGELTRMLDCICTNETQFFREPGQFTFLEETVFPEWRRQARAGERPRTIRAWSAACSTGEEPYSLAMALLWHFPARDGWRVELLATDLSATALAAARQGEWNIDRARHVPHHYLRRFMRRGTRSMEGRMRATQEVRSAIRFGRLNLNAPEYPALGRFDLLLCRNVLIYFSDRGREAVLHRLIEHLDPGGYLLLGHAEHPGLVLDRMEPLRTMIYRAPPRTRN